MTDPAFWTPAADRPQLWRTALGTVLTGAIWTAGALALVWLGGRVSGLPSTMVIDTTRWTGAAMFFLTFIGLHLGLAVTLPLLHQRGYASLFGPSRRLDRAHLRNGALVMLGTAAALYALLGVEQLVLPEGVAPEITRLQHPGDWIIGLAPALFLIFIQVSAEEAVFRGYLLQQLRARSRSPLVWAVLPALIFGALHFDPGRFGLVNASAYVINAATMGTLAAFVTMRTGNLGAAIGLHFGNNAALTLFGLEGQLSGFSLYGVAMDPASGYATYSIVTQTVVVAVIFVVWWRWMNRHRPIANPPRPA